MMIVLFRSKLTGDAGEDYAATSAAMLEHARQRPGFVDFRQYTGVDDGERLTVVRFEDEATLEDFRADARHRAAKRLGREKWYAWYDVEIAKLVHRSRFERDEEG